MLVGLCSKHDNSGVMHGEDDVELMHNLSPCRFVGILQDLFVVGLNVTHRHAIACLFLFSALRVTVCLIH